MISAVSEAGGRRGGKREFDGRRRERLSSTFASLAVVGHPPTLLSLIGYVSFSVRIEYVQKRLVISVNSKERTRDGGKERINRARPSCLGFGRLLARGGPILQ